MKRGHITGHKRERKGATPHFDAIQQAWLRKIEAEVAQKAQQPQPKQAA